MICKGTLVFLDGLDLLTIVYDTYSKISIIITEWK